MPSRSSVERAASYLAASANRKAILDALRAGPRTPTQLAEAIKRRPNHVSFYLKGMKEIGLVQSLDPTARKGRLYAATTLAAEVRQFLGHNP